MDTIRQVAKVPTDMTDRPRIPVHIFNCGEVLEDAQDEGDSEDSEEAAASNAFAIYQRQRRLKK